VDWDGNLRAAANIISGDGGSLDYLAGLMWVPYISYSMTNTTTADSLNVFLTAYMKYAYNNYIAPRMSVLGFTSPARHIYIGLACPNSMGVIIFNIYGDANA